MTTEARTTEQQRRKLGELATAEQRLAADPTLSVWVNASAGTGKTKVLSDRVLRLLLAGVNPGRLLCLTYTKAAAVEMSARVSKKLSGWAVASEQELENELDKLYGTLPQDQKQAEELKARARKLFAVLLDTPGGIKIQTIHSFCQEILKRFPLEAGVSPYFEIMDDRAAAEAAEEIKNRLIAEIRGNPGSPAAEAMAFLTENVSELKFPEIIGTIINERGKISRLFKRWSSAGELLAAQAARLGVAPDADERELNRLFFDALPREELKTLLAAWLKSGVRFARRAEKLAAALQNSAPEDFTDYAGAFLGSDGEAYKTVAAKAVLENNPRLAEIFAEEAARVREQTEKQKALRVFLATKAVVVLAGELTKGYENYKQAHALMDYNDMILLTRRLLDDREAARWVLFKLDGGIDDILIDEAQDTSPDQWAIIRAVSEEFFASEDGRRRTVFAVGDRKQSIYSFQGADPDKFDEMRRYFAQKTDRFKQVDLQVSFRSTPAVLDTVNRLFSDPKVSAGVASADEKPVHVPFRRGEGGEVELWELVEPEEGENADEWQPPVEHENAPTTGTRMARMIAEKIHAMVAGGEMLVSRGRPLRYSDFLILVRSRDAFCEELIRECKKAGVRIAGIDRIRLLEQIAVQDLVSLGKFLLLPEDDLSLAEVLKSPLFGLDDDDLFKLCYRRSGSLWKSLEQCSDYAAAAETLKRLMNMADYVRPFELYSEVLGVLHGRRLFAERMGSEAEDGLDEFLNLAAAFEQNHIASLQKFIEWFESDDVEIKREAEAGGGDLVRLMTVHGSKGLQAPVVILPDTARVPQCKREAGILWDDDGLFFYPSSSADYEKNCDRMKEKQKQKTAEEYRRLMYVALTRAEDRMIVCGWRKARKPADDSWYNLFKNSFESISELNPSDGIRRHVSPQLIKTAEEKQTAAAENAFSFAPWTETPAPAESPLSRPLTPSRPEEDEPAVFSPLAAAGRGKPFKRGSLIHRLLQFLPQTEKRRRESDASAFIARHAPEANDEEREKIVREVLSLLDNPDFGSVFGPQSKAEVPVMGVVGGKIVSGRIDRLIVEPGRVVIVDFKTNRPAAACPAEVPEIYRRQLAAYRSLLERIYPDKKIISLILWTNTARLMAVE